MKKYIQITITILLFIFSFYYTNKIVDIIKYNDPLMKEIITKRHTFEKEAIEPIITNSTIIPGANGYRIKLEESYDKMKSLGLFNPSLLVFEEYHPKNLINNYYDKVIISGNSSKNNISLLFQVDDINILEYILKILKDNNVNGNFYFSNNFILNNINKIKKIDEHNIVGVLSDNLNTNQYIDYCISFNLNYQKDCTIKKVHTILSSINITNYPYTYTKNNIKNGSIINYNLNKENIHDLPLIINYINNNDYNIVSINQLIQE